MGNLFFMYKYEIVQYNDLYLLRRSLFGKFFRRYYNRLPLSPGPGKFIPYRDEMVGFLFTKDMVERLYCEFSGINGVISRVKEKTFKVIR